MSSELVTVAVFAISADAELVRTQLVAAGIESQLTTGGKAGPAGQVHVQVAQGDFERAMRVLFPVPEPSRAPTSEIGSWTCPKCGQSVFDFSDVCWLCGTSREGAPPAPVVPETLAPGMLAPGMGAPGMGAPGIATNEAPASKATDSSPSVAQESASKPSSSPSSSPPRAAAAAPRMPRFAQFPMPPPPGMVPAAEPPPAQGGVPQEGPSAVPRFARLKPVAVSPVEMPETQTLAETGASVESGASVERSAVAEVVAPVAPAAPVEQAPDSTVAEAPVAEAPPTSRLIIPVGPPRTRAPVDLKQKEIESMARWAWWTAVVGVLVCPATVYSIWVLLTLTFAGARPSGAGRLRFVGAWCVNLATIIGWHLWLRQRM